MLPWIILSRLTSTARLASKQLFMWKNTDLLFVVTELIVNNSECYGTTYTHSLSNAFHNCWCFLEKSSLFCLVWFNAFFLVFLQLRSLRITWDGVRSTHTHLDECSKLSIILCLLSLSSGTNSVKNIYFTLFFGCALFFLLSQSHLKIVAPLVGTKNMIGELFLQ